MRAVGRMTCRRGADSRIGDETLTSSGDPTDTRTVRESLSIHVHAQSALRRAVMLPIALLLLTLLAVAAQPDHALAMGVQEAEAAAAPATAVRGTGPKGRRIKPRRAAVACSASMVANGRTFRSLRRLGFRPAGKGRWTRRVSKRMSITVCTRRAANPRWLERQLGRPVTTGRRTREARRDPSPISYPLRLDGRLDLALPEGLGRSGWTMLDVPPAPRRSYLGGARYVTDGYDVLFESGYGRVKESIVVHQRQGVRSWGWRLHWTKGTAPYVNASGDVVFGGKVVLDRPVVMSRTGRTVLRPRWQVDGAVVSFRVDDARLALPYVVDPTADFPQRIHPDRVPGTRITGAEELRGAIGSPSSSCTKLPLRATGEALFASMIARDAAGGGAIATATPSGGANGWAVQDGTTFTNGKKIYGVAAPSDNVVYAVGEEGLAIKTVDGGCSWTRLTTGTTQELRSVAAPSVDVVWVAGKSGTVRRSTNGGASFANAGSTGLTSDLHVIDAVSATFAMVAGASATAARTTDGGATWSSMTGGMAGSGGATYRALDMFDANVAWIAGDGKIWRTTNGGANWGGFQTNFASAITALAAVNSTTAYAAGDGGRIYRSGDGATWIEQITPIADRLDWIAPVSTNVAWAGGANGRLLHTTNGGATWTLQTSPSTVAGLTMFGGVARSANLAWTVDERGRVQRFHPASPDGSHGWVTQAPGGTTLPSTDWTIGARLCREPFSGGSVDLGFRARVWKVTVDGSGALTGSTPVTPWSAASASIALAGGACTDATVAVTPTGTSLLPTQHLYVEYALRVNGNARADETLDLRVADAGTYIDFSAPAGDSTPAPTNLRLDSPIGPNGWTNVTTPTLRANLVDPDWWHHNRYQVCADPACTTIVAEGTSPLGQVLGSTNDAWTTSALPDGFYYMRTRTEEDGGETDQSAWTPIDPDLAVNRCTAQNVGPCDKFGVDTALPTAPSAVNDGTGADIDWTGSTTTLSANWGASTDAGGINRYEYCMSTGTSSNDCTGTIVQAWTSSGPGTSVTRTGLSLGNGITYFTCVRAIDNAGNTGASTCSNGVIVDTSPPPATAGVRDGAAADQAYTADPTELVANWDAVSDVLPGSGLARYDVCFTGSSTGADCAGTALSPWTANATLTSATRTGLSLPHASTWHACVRAVDNVGNIGAVRCSDGITVDTAGPTWPSGYSRDGAGPGDIEWTTSSTSLQSHWSAAADMQPVARYEYCLSTSVDCSAGIVVGWTSSGLVQSQTSTGLTLDQGTRYHSCVRAYDESDNVSASLCSDGQRVDSVAPVLPPAVSDGTGADLTWLRSLTTASANWPGGSDATSGIANWEYCISTGVGCTGTIAKTWTANGTGTTQTSSGLLLGEGRLYYTCVRGTDVAGNASAGFACSDGQRVDTVAPPAPAFVNDGTGADIQWSSSATTLEANWGPVADPPPPAGVESGMQAFQYCITTTSGGGNCALGTATVAWTAMSPVLGTSLSRSGLALVDNTTYYVCVRSFDIAGNEGGTRCSNGNTVDLGPPTASWTRWNVTHADPARPRMYSPPGSSLLWYNPAAEAGTGGTATGVVTATDLASGMNRVEFPDLGAGPAWGPGGTDSTVGTADTWTHGYTFAGGGAIGDPALNNATAYDNGGAFTGSPQLDFDIRPDGAAPAVGTMPALGGGLQNATSWTGPGIPLGSDADSGIARWVMDVRFAPMYDGACGSWEGWLAGDSDLPPGYAGTASNGSTLANSHWLNDPNLDGIADYRDAFCFQMRVRVFDQVGNMALIPENGYVRFDFGSPSVAISGPPDGSAQSGTFTITGTADDAYEATQAFEYDLTGSGLDRVTVRYERVGDPATNGNACAPVTSFGGPWTAHTWSCAWATGGGALPDGDYLVRVQARDRAGNLSTVATHTYRLDNNPPVVAWHSWDDGGSAWMHSVGALAWVNPSATPGSYQLHARVTATDAGSGVDRVEFPGLGANWTPASGFTNATFTSPSPVSDAYTMTYSFSDPGLIAPPGPRQATAYDGAGNPAPIPFEVRLDGMAPTGMEATVAGTRQSTATVAVTLVPGAEAAAGSGLGSWALLYDRAPLADDTCGAFSGIWTVAATGPGSAPNSYSHDVTAGGSGCYRYMLEARDNVGNVGTSTPATMQRVDLDDPTVAITSPADGSAQGGTFTVGGTAGDAHSGVDRVALTWTRTSPTAGSGTICDPATLAGSSPSWTFSCSWSTAALPDGTYVVTAHSYDRAGRVSSSSTITLFLDNNPPYVAFHSFAEASPYTHWSGPTGTNDQLWYNPDAPAGSHSFDVLFTVSDPSGISRVEFPGAGAGWTPGATIATQTVPVTTDRYAQTYAFDTSGTVASPGTRTVTGYDAANNPATGTFRLTPDTAAPSDGSVTAPNGFHGSTSVDVAVDTGTDAESGIASWRLLRSDGTLSGTTCGAWGAYSTVVATGTGAASGTRPDTVTDPGCFRWRLEVTDNVGRSALFDGTDETMIDLTPPTGTIALAEGTNPQFQHLASPTRLWVNTTALGSGSFTATVNATAASGIRDVTFPAIATGFTGAGTMPGPGPGFVRSYSWTGPTGAPATGLAANVRSNSLGPLALPFEVLGDAAGPTSATPTHVSGFTTATSVDVTFTAATDAGSGVASQQLQKEVGTLAGGTCTWPSAWTDVAGATTPGTYTVATAHATCVRFRNLATDNVSNPGASPSSTPIMVDTTAPTGASIDLTPATNAARQYRLAPDHLWVAADPGGSASFSATVTATDPESGTGAATFPALGSTFVFTSTGAYTGTYTFGATAVEPAPTPTVQVANGSGLTTTIPFTISVDGDAPSGATLDQENGFVADFQVDVTFAGGGDGTGSGIATWRLERQAAPYDYAVDTCGTWSSWSAYPAPAGQPTSPFVDTSVVQPTCYRYRLVELDRVGNRTETYDASGDIAKVVNDIWPPEPFSIVLPTNPALPPITTGTAAPSCASVPTYASDTPGFSWTASSDAHSGLSHYAVHLDGAASPTATVAAPGTSWTSGVLTNGAHTLGVRAHDFMANFRNAGPSFPTAIRIDTAPPTGTLASPAAGTWTSDTTPTLTWTAADSNCVARVEVSVDGSVVAVASGSETSWTPSTALSSGPHSWSIRVIDTLGTATTIGPVTFGIDTTPPTAPTITAPTAGQTVRGFVNVSWTASTDGGSGLSSASAYRVYVDGALRATLAAGTTSTTVGSITNGGHSVVVRATDAVGNFIESAPVLFTGYGVIPAPVLVSPADKAFLNAVPTVEWTWPSDGGPPPTSYDVQVDGAVVGSELHPTMTHTIPDPGDGTHSWRIIQHDPYTGTVQSVLRTFTLDRTPPTNPGPLTRSATTVSWPAPSDPAAPVASGIARQEFWIDNGTTQTVTNLAAGLTNRNYGSLPDGTYTMWVRAFDRAGNATNSPAITVVNDSQPPTAFNLTPPPPTGPLPAITHGSTVAPTCEAAPTYATTTPTLQWSASSDATSGLAGYDVYVDGALRATVGPSVTSYPVTTALAGGAHTWRVVARDNFGLERASNPDPMNVRVDGAAPAVTLGSPADNAFTSDSTPLFSWTATDDNCVARVELTVGAATYVLSGTAGSYSPTAALSEGPTTWSVRVFDSVGNVTASATRTVHVDTTAPTGVTAVFPTNAGSAPEQMMTFEWSAGSDGTGSGVARYDLIVDGTTVATNLSATSRGVYAIYEGAHTWAIRARDAVGNSALFSFTFTATPVPDVTAPDPFNLLTPADGAALPAGSALTWEAAWDFKGVTQYRVFIDGNLAGTTSGSVRSFTPSTGAGAPRCAAIDYDPDAFSPCIGTPTYSHGTGAGTTASGLATSSHMNVAAFTGWSAGGSALGVGNPTVTPITQAAAGFDGSKAWTAATYQVAVPASGADLRFEHRYRTHVIGESAYDGATVEVMVDKDGGGFGNDVWESTCEFNAKAIYGTTLDCMYEIVDLNGGYTAVMGGASKTDHPISGQHSFAGDSGGMVQTRMTLAAFAGKDVRVRFRVGMDACFTGITGSAKAWCDDPEFGAPGYHPAQWRIDNVTLADPALLPGLHTWRVQARDAAGNFRWSTQTWTFDLQP